MCVELNDGEVVLVFVVCGENWVGDCVIVVDIEYVVIGFEFVFDCLMYCGKVSGVVKYGYGV